MNKEELFPYAAIQRTNETEIMCGVYALLGLPFPMATGNPCRVLRKINGEKTMIKMAAFNHDGTICDSSPMCMEVFRRAVTPYAGHELSEDEIRSTFGLNEIGMGFLSLSYF